MAEIFYLSRMDFLRAVHVQKEQPKPKPAIIDPVEGYVQEASKFLFADPLKTDTQEVIVLNKETFESLIRNAIDYGIYLVADKHAKK